MAAMDLTKAYWQCPVAEEDQHKTTFTCDRGNFEFLRVPMGIAGAPAYYQAAVRHVLGAIKLDNDLQLMENYLDDVIIAATTYELFIDAVRLFFIRMREVNMAISLKKSKFGSSSVHYLGFVVTADT